MHPVLKRLWSHEKVFIPDACVVSDTISIISVRMRLAVVP